MIHPGGGLVSFQGSQVAQPLPVERLKEKQADYHLKASDTVLIFKC